MLLVLHPGWRAEWTVLLGKLCDCTLFLEPLKLVFGLSSLPDISLNEVLSLGRLSLRQTRCHRRVYLLDLLPAVHEVVLLPVDYVLLVLRQGSAVGVEVLIVLHYHLLVLLRDLRQHLLWN